MEIQLRFHGYSTGIELDLPPSLEIRRLFLNLRCNRSPPFMTFNKWRDARREFDSRKNRRRWKWKEVEMFRQRLFANGSNVPLRLELPLIFPSRVTKERGKRMYNVEGCVRRKSFFSIAAVTVHSQIPLLLVGIRFEWMEISENTRATTRCSRMQSRKSSVTNWNDVERRKR